MRPFLLKHCTEGGAIPSVNCVSQFHLPKLFFILLAWKPDETTDCSDQNILNVIASICRELFLIDVVTLREYNHQTLS